MVPLTDLTLLIVCNFRENNRKGFKVDENIRLCNDKSGLKCDAINMQTQYDKETLLNIRKTVQNDFRLKILDTNTMKNIQKIG